MQPAASFMIYYLASNCDLPILSPLCMLLETARPVITCSCNSSSVIWSPCRIDIVKGVLHHRIFYHLFLCPHQNDAGRPGQITHSSLRTVTTRRVCWAKQFHKYFKSHLLFAHNVSFVHERHNHPLCFELIISNSNGL